MTKQKYSGLSQKPVSHDVCSAHSTNMKNLLELVKQTSPSIVQSLSCARKINPLSHRRSRGSRESSRKRFQFMHLLCLPPVLAPVPTRALVKLSRERSLAMNADFNARPATLSRRSCKSSAPDALSVIHGFETRSGFDELELRVRSTINYVRHNLSANLSLAQLAKINGISSWHCCRLFTATIGLSPSRCIKLLRLKAAADLLTGTTMSVKEVAAAVGINSQSHFVRDFQATFGCSPKKYRMQHRNQPSVARKCQDPTAFAKIG